MDTIEARLANIERQLGQQRAPKETVLEKIENLRRFRQTCLANQARAALQARQAAQPKQTERTRHIYRKAGHGVDGFRLSLMGFDFENDDERSRVLSEYRACLRACGIDESEANDLRHSWQIAVHRYSSPNHGSTSAYCQTGKKFLIHGKSWRASLDLTPGSVGLKLFEKYRDMSL